MTEFIPYPKIPRLNRDIIITEKIDGTNAAIRVNDDGTVAAQSRSRVLIPGQSDNFGFGAWVHGHAKELSELLGPGLHFGEWWGAGVQRRYGLITKAFSLFHVGRWGFLGTPGAPDPVIGGVPVRVVPKLYEGPWHLSSGIFAPAAIAEDLTESGSKAAPGFLKPEGIVVFHSASGSLYKVTIEGDEKPKGQATE